MPESMAEKNAARAEEIEGLLDKAYKLSGGLMPGAELDRMKADISSAKQAAGRILETEAGKAFRMRPRAAEGRR